MFNVKKLICLMRQVVLCILSHFMELHLQSIWSECVCAGCFSVVCVRSAKISNPRPPLHTSYITSVGLDSRVAPLGTRLAERSTDSSTWFRRLLRSINYIDYLVSLTFWSNCIVYIHTLRIYSFKRKKNLFLM